MRKHLVISTVVLLTSSVITACSTGPDLDKERANRIISQIDMNGSREASWEESQIKAESQFMELDLNKDGYLSAEEYASYIPILVIGKNAPPEPLSMFDQDDDGKLSKAEFITMADRRFSMMDRNRDGLLTESDFVMKKKGMGGPGGMGGRGPGGGGMGRGGMGSGMPGSW